MRNLSECDRKDDSCAPVTFLIVASFAFVCVRDSMTVASCAFVVCVNITLVASFANFNYESYLIRSFGY